MDSEFIKLLSMMAETELTDDNMPEAMKTAEQLEHWMPEKLPEQGSRQDIINTAPDIRMPDYLKEQILTRSRQPDMQALTAPKRFSRRMELFLYGCKVSAAVATSLLIMVTASVTQSQLRTLPQPETTFPKETEIQRDVSGTILEHLTSGSRYVTGWLQDFSSGIVNADFTKKQN